MAWGFLPSITEVMQGDLRGPAGVLLRLHERRHERGRERSMSDT